ncbi:MAG: ABC transporter ATP-binding protein [Bacillota bacterium]|nr:ABC transporter ATP-binding protein [Bacillota bacterium]
MKTSNYGFVKVMSKMYSFIKKYKLLVATYIVLAVLNILLSLVMANLINGSINSAVSHNKSELYYNIFQMSITIIIGVLITYFSTYAYGIFKARVMIDIRNHAIMHLEKFPLSFMESNHTGDIISRFTNDLDSVQTFIGDDLFKTIIQFISIIIISVYLIMINLKLYIATFIVIPPALFMLGVISKPMQKYFKEASKSLGKANSIAQDSYGGIFIIKAFNLEKLFEKKFSDNINRGLKYDIKGVHRLKYMPPCNIILRSMPYTICLIYGAYLSINKEISPGRLLSFVYLIGNIISFFAYLPSIISSLANSLGTTERFFEILDEPTEREGGECFKNLNALSSVCFKDVSFSYNAEQKILNNLSFKINKGSKIALVGSSGCGKSTLLKLIFGFYNQQSGDIELFGHNSKEWNLNSLRSNISYVSQDAYLFPGSIFENILIGNLNAEKEQVVKAAKIANAHEFILELPDGYETMVGERGIKLSGGQRQRISLARAVLKNAPIILLDEPTSALDTLSESTVQNALEKVMEGKTVIIVAHRLSTIKNVDEIIVMNNGCIVERGTHSQLVETDSLYAKLYNNQFDLNEINESV